MMTPLPQNGSRGQDCRATRMFDVKKTTVSWIFQVAFAVQNLIEKKDIPTQIPKITPTNPQQSQKRQLD